MNYAELIEKMIDAKQWAHEKGETFKDGTMSQGYYSGYEDGIQFCLNHAKKLEIDNRP